MENRILATLETKLSDGKETIEIWRYGNNDYAAYFHNADCSVRGTFLEVMAEITTAWECENLKEA